MSTDPNPTVATSYFGQLPTWALLMILIMYTIAVVWLTVKIVKMLNDSRWHWVLGKFVWPTKKSTYLLWTNDYFDAYGLP